ncbi:MAG: RluA family pseudouridine synthase [Planctomycetia bacterium]|nr:RluA family pseudouridine synthase [Planctomycetia bacterium]
MTGANAHELIELRVEPHEDGCRLDFFLAQRLPRYSRVHLRKVINAALVKVDGKHPKAAQRLIPGQLVSLVLPDLPKLKLRPEDLPLEIVYEDEHIVVLNKAAGMIVHPGRGNPTGTLAGALQFHFDTLSTVAGPTRPGIVHRLDRDTSGVIVVAKTDVAHLDLSDQFERRAVEKEYFAIVVGRMDRDRDFIDAPIGPHPHQREKMAVRKEHPQSRDARTFYEVVKRYSGYSTVRLLPKTGRTHQIRVHLFSLGHPVLCDKLYGGRDRITLREIDPKAAEDGVLLSRQALHARRLKFTHPKTGQPMEFAVPVPADMQSVVDALERRS